jgi:small subunit ribosomal protein S17
MAKTGKKLDQKKTENKEKSVDRKRVIEGVVVKKSGDKTIKVEVLNHKSHPLYSKRAVRSKYYLVHDPEGLGEIGQEVFIKEARSLSKRKKYVLVKKEKDN